MSLRVSGGRLRGRRLRLVRVVGLRPTTEVVRRAIFSILGPETIVGGRVLDLYAGSGALGIEALSRGAASADFVEVSPRLIRMLEDNLRKLDLHGRSHAYRSEAESALEKLPGGYDVAFCDPPYDFDGWDSLMGALGCGRLIKQNGRVVVEHRHGTTLAEEHGALARTESRRYGDTSISFFTCGAVIGKGHLPG